MKKTFEDMNREHERMEDKDMMTGWTSRIILIGLGS